MHRILSILCHIVCSMAVLLVVAACQPPGASSPTAVTPGGIRPTTPNPEPTAVDSTPGVVDTEWTFGPGPLIFLNGTAGLAKLSSYQAALTITFHGTNDGKPQEWSANYVMLATQDPARRQLTLTNTGDGQDPARVYKAEVSGVAYERRGDQPCTAAVLDQKKSLAAQWEPAGFLNGIQGGVKVGSETVGGLETDRYTFDERAFGPLPPSKSDGQVWIAAKGSYIVRYLVTTEAKADYFGEGIEGTITWDYQLTRANEPVVIERANDCPGGMIDAPRLADAANVKDGPALMRYTTASSLAETAKFYQQKLPALGWQPAGDPVVSKTLVLQDYTRADQQLAVIATAGEGRTTVQILLGPIQP
jgi:hypothetical protein